METLEAIIRPELFGHYTDWLSRASDREKKGLKLIQQILDSKGRKRLP